MLIEHYFIGSPCDCFGCRRDVDSQTAQYTGVRRGESIGADCLLDDLLWTNVEEVRVGHVVEQLYEIHHSLVIPQEVPNKC